MGSSIDDRVDPSRKRDSFRYSTSTERTSMSERRIFGILLLLGAMFVAYRANFSERGVGKVYVVPVETAARITEKTVTTKSNREITIREGEFVDLTAEPNATDVITQVGYRRASPSATGAQLSYVRTAGVWIAALLTLCVLSYLYRDNIFYKFAESVVVGVSAGYWVVYYFWEVVIGKAFVRLLPDLARATLVPETSIETVPDYYYLIPVILGLLIFLRLVPKLSWLGRWPLAFVIGTTAGIKLVVFLNSDFVRQIKSTMLPLIVFQQNESEKVFNWAQSLNNFTIVASVLACLTYFFFSVEHKGIIGRISRLGVWVLMIAFGGSFAFTVMGRITLLTVRLQFLFDDWLGLVKS
jgi:hypothetical protein